MKESSLLQDLTLKISPSLTDRSQSYFSFLRALETCASQTEQPDRPHTDYMKTVKVVWFWYRDIVGKWEVVGQEGGLFINEHK